MERDTVNDYMIVKESMGSVSSYDPRPTIAKWLAMRERRPKRNDNCEKVEKYKNNEFVRKFFFKHSIRNYDCVVVCIDFNCFIVFVCSLTLLTL